MAGDITTKVRLVRCPKCRLVLPELPEFNVYKCGGCDTTLQGTRFYENYRSNYHVMICAKSSWLYIYIYVCVYSLE